MTLTSHNVTIEARAFATPVHDSEIVEVADSTGRRNTPARRLR
jgi:hypothetical protein